MDFVSLSYFLCITRVEIYMSRNICGIEVQNDLTCSLCWCWCGEESGEAKKTAEKFAGRSSLGDGQVKYEAKFEVSGDFGEVGAVLVRNERTLEMFIRTITLTGFSSGPLHFTCNSWVQPKNINSEKRIFFTNKVLSSYFLQNFSS